MEPTRGQSARGDLHGPSGPRERALDEGLDALGDAELLALLIGTGTSGRSAARVALDLLEAVGDLPGLARVGPRLLSEHPGLGVVKALRLAASIELGKRVLARAATPRHPLASSSHVAAWFTARLGPLEHEEMWAVALDARNGLRGARRVALGGLHGCSVTTRDVLRTVLLDAASAFVVVHNHPSGDPTPSPEDVTMTRTLEEAGVLVGVPLLDHVVVTASGKYASMLDLGILSP